jgi:hypothetical protein
VLVLWVFLEKIVNNQNLDAINIFQGHKQSTVGDALIWKIITIFYPENVEDC